MNRMLPEKINQMHSDGVFDAPEWPHYFKPKD